MIAQAGATFAPEVQIETEQGKAWLRNSMRFETRQEAMLYLQNLLGRWSVHTMISVRATEDRRNALWRTDKREVERV